MSDEQTRKQQAAEAAAIRRRWVTLGELLAVAAVVISGLTLWNSYVERTETEAERTAERRAEEAQAGTLVMSGRVEDDGEALLFVAEGADRSIQALTVRFPSALGLSPAETLADARLDVATLARAVRSASDAERLRLPVAVEARFTAGGRLRTATGLYQIGLVRRDRLIGADALRFTGVAYQGVGGADAPAQIDRLWRPATE